jgi:hydroxyethylthiazole kinase
MKISLDALVGNLKTVRTESPLVHNITNYVVMNFSANVLLAAGASPVMAHAVEEVAEMVEIAGALVLNIGTLERSWNESMRIAAKTARLRERPIVLDPVGAGATPFRTHTALNLLEESPPAILRGNASEILALGNKMGQTRGVDSRVESSAAVEAARDLARTFHTVVVVSGPVDYIVSAERMVRLHNGHPLMARVTGTGCACSALCGAFAAVEPDPFVAAVAAMATASLAGELAAEKASGPGSFGVAFLDELASLDSSGFERLRLD